MATFTKRIGWLAVTAAMLLIVPIAQADDDGSGDNSGGVSAPDNTAYYQAYQQWLQFQQKIYEDRRHDWEVGQEQLKKDRLDRQLYHPPLTEIWAAEPLNALLFRLQDLGNRGARFAEVGIPKNVLAHMNLTTGISPGNVAMLKDNGVLDWPMALRQPEFKPLETQLGSLTSRLIAEVKAGEVNADEYHTAVTLVDLGKEQLMSNIKVMSPSEYIQGKRYLNDLSDAIKVFSQPDAARCFRKQSGPKGNTVKAVVEYMTRKGLRFAPAAAQDKAAYLALHQALVSCFLAMNTDGAAQDALSPDSK